MLLMAALPPDGPPSMKRPSLVVVLLVLVLLVGLGLRLALWGQLPRQGLISDEAEYLAAADWLAQGRGFAWHSEWLWTRAPLYPLFLAAHMRLFGFALEPIYASQLALSLLNVLLVYGLARQAAAGLPPPLGQRSRAAVALGAALLAALYLPFATYAQLILSETLYLTLLLAVFGLLGGWSRAAPAGRWWYGLPLAAGVLLGLAALTRGLTLAFVPFVAGWVWYVARQRARRAERPGGRVRWLPLVGLLLAWALTLAPWSLYASRAYGGPVLVDTTGGFNLLLGARTAYDGERMNAPTRQFVQALLDPRLSQSQRVAFVEDSCLLAHNDPRLRAALQRPVSEIGQAERQRLMLAEGLCLLQARPGAFAAKSAAELVDLFQINYTGAERMSGGFTQGRLPVAYALALFVLDDTLYVLLLPLAVVGLGLALTLRQAGTQGAGSAYLAGLVGLWWLYNLLTAPLLFAINRFRIPLLPFACIYAALALVLLVAWLRGVPLAAPGRAAALVRGAFAGLALLLALLAWTPYAYLQEPPAAWASYLGPYPSSLDITQKAVASRTAASRNAEQALIAALGSGDVPRARALIEAGNIPTDTLRLARPLLAGLEGRPQEGLALLPATRVISATDDWQAAVVRGDLLRRLGEERAAKTAFTPTYVDDQNPVGWAWRWLYPVPTRHIDLGGNLDLGYIEGFYLGEGDQTAAGDGTFRWSTATARLLFPGQGRSQPQQVCLRADGRGWPADLPPPRFDLLLVEPSAQPLATLQLERDVRVYCADLPPTTPGADLLIGLRSDTFVPDAIDLLAQQGPQQGQLRRLGLRLDWVEMRDAQ